ncbi:hypothetical protein BDN70DRAFT_880663 [Pholiota conissans]|uniref:BTB domain-containing protein n=1 Tax=Pholiota conissans TaxID=109636 RepID=A0A9P5YZ70_9AGAR|nr:hypothetical protein BDN70DRAFT_880663 [Pholiota conissans]
MQDGAMAIVCAIRPHDTYYFQNVIFEVGCTHYRVPKGCLDYKGTPFPDLFAPLTLKDDNGDYAEPIRLEGISEKQFEGFLRAVFPIFGTPFPTESVIGALELAVKWNFSKLQVDLTNQLEPSIKDLSLHETIRIARLSRKRKWLVDVFVDLIDHRKPLELVALMQNGIDASTVAKLLEIRERFANVSAKPSTESLVADCFSAELKNMGIWEFNTDTC